MLLSNQIGRLVDLYHVKLAWYKREIKEKKKSLQKPTPKKHSHHHMTDKILSKQMWLVLTVYIWDRDQKINDQMRVQLLALVTKIGLYVTYSFH